jgi:hypothetical protein
MKERIMRIRSIGLLGWISAIIVFGFVLIQGCGQSSTPKFQTEYQAVLLASGQVVFGKAEFLGTDYILMKDVFFIHSQVNPETKQMAGTLIRKGQEWHGAEQMYINTRHIISIEPVAPESRVAKLIKEAQAQKPEGKK